MFNMFPKCNLNDKTHVQIIWYNAIIQIQASHTSSHERQKLNISILYEMGIY